MKTNTKNTKKTVKPTYTVDITDCDNTQDVAFKFAIAKQKAGVPLSNENVEAIRVNAEDMLIEYLFDAGYLSENPINVICVQNKPKKNVFKRFWNWLIGKKD